MQRHDWIPSTVLALSGALLMASPGCARPRAKAVVAETVPAPAPAELPPRTSPSDDAAAAHAHYGAGVIHELNDEPEAALREYAQAALADPDNEPLILEVSRRYLQNKQFDKALELVSRSAARPHASGQIFARLGLIYAQLGKYEQAVAAGRTAIKKSPGLFAAYQNLFLNYLQNKHLPEALSVLDEAAKQPNTNAEFLLNLSELYLNFALQAPTQKEKVHAKARAVLKRAAKLNPSGIPLRLMLADGLNLVGETDQAAQLYLDLLKRLQDVPALRQRVHAKLTDIYLQGKDHKHAVEQLQAIVRDDPTNPLAYYYLGSIAYEDKKLAEAAEYFSKTILLNPDFEQAYFDLASAQISLDKTSDALVTLGKARQKFDQNKQDFGLELLTAMAFGRQKAYAEAIQHYTAAEAIAKATDPKRLTHFFYFQLGAAYERQKDYGHAEQAFQKCLELAPNFAEALNYLGYMWAEHGTKLDQAHELIEKAVKAEPKNAAFLDSLGWVLFKLNQPKEALTYALQAAQLSAEPDATVYDHLGDIYAALRQPDKAREAWRKSLSLEANEEVRKKIEAH
jgi:tetratricopeptide (TPR) repeat protein